MEAVKKEHSSSSHSNKSDGKKPFLGIQAKLNVNKPGDKYEVEADQAAEKVVSKQSTPTPAFVPSTSPVQLKQEDEQPVVQEKPIAAGITPFVQAKEDEPAQAQEEEVQAKEEDLQAKEEEPAQMMEEEPAQAQEEDLQAKEDESAQMMEEEPAQAKEDDLQAKEYEEVQTKLQPSAPSTPSKPSINDQLSSSKGSGSPLSGGVKQEMESGFGADFGGVKIHTDDRAASMSKEIGAQAFTNKGDIYFNQGKFNPATQQGKTLLAHELTHTIQQGAAGEKKEQSAADTDKAVTPGDKNAAGDKAQPTGQGETSTDKTTDQPQLGTETPRATAGAATTSGAPSLTPTIPGKVAPIEGTPLTADALTAEGEVPVEGEAVEEKKQPSPEEDPNFLAVTAAISEESVDQESTEDPDALSEDALDAAKSPSEEAESFAMADQVGRASC